MPKNPLILLITIQVFSFFQVAMFGLIAVVVFCTIVKTMQESTEN